MKSLILTVTDDGFLATPIAGKRTKKTQYIIRLDDSEPDIRISIDPVVNADRTAPLSIQYVDEGGDLAYKTVILKVEKHE